MTKNKKGKIIDSTMIKFVIVGAINTLVGIGAMFLTLHILKALNAPKPVSYWGSSAANIIVGSIVSYLLNKYFTFQSNTKSKDDMVKFIINIAICYLIAYGIAQPISNKIFSGASEQVLEIVSLLSGAVLFTIINYFGQRFWVFKEDKK